MCAIQVLKHTMWKDKNSDDPGYQTFSDSEIVNGERDDLHCDTKAIDESTETTCKGI